MTTHHTSHGQNPTGQPATPLQPINPRRDLDKLEKLFGVYRDYIKVEHDLQNHRSTWHLLMQGFLFATLGVLGEWQIGKDLPIQLQTEREWLPYILMITGGVIAFLTWISIEAAALALREIIKAWNEQSALEFDADFILRVPNIRGGGSRWAAIFGQVAPRFIPIIALIAWIGVAYMYHKDQKTNDQRAAASVATSAVSIPAAGRFLPISAQTHTGIALDTATGTACRMWEWKPSKQKEDPAADGMKTCSELYQVSLKNNQ